MAEKWGRQQFCLHPFLGERNLKMLSSLSFSNTRYRAILPHIFCTMICISIIVILLNCESP